MKRICILLIFGCASAVWAQTDIVGGRDQVDRSEWPRLFDKLSESLVRLATQSDGAHLNLEEILSAEKQVVGGRKYFVDARVTPARSDSKICKFEIYERPWEKFQQVDVECEDNQKYQVVRAAEKKRSKRGVLVGGPQEVDEEQRARLQGIIQESLVTIGQRENGRNLFYVRIKDAKSKVVSGVLYTVIIEVSEKDQANSECEVTIWEKQWKNWRDVTTKCGTDEFKVTSNSAQGNARRRRSIKPLLEESEFEEAVDEAADTFAAFKLAFNRSYGSDHEHALRFRIFKQNLFVIEQLNKYELGTGEYGITEFTDMTNDEYFGRTGLKIPAGYENRIRSPAPIPDIEVPDAFDWRDKGAVTPVKNQGGCGSCWAFSVTGNVEGVNFARTGQLLSLSEQELLDCDTVDQACNGGLPDDAYKAIERIGGLETESEYPYHARKGKCQYDPNQEHVSVSGAVDLPKDEVAIAKYLAENGPVSIGINANAMQFYHRGVAHPWKALCRPDALDHGVLIVGFGVDTGKKGKKLPYWIVKNSWGPGWGEKGYYRVYRGDNTCGVASMASSAVL